MELRVRRLTASPLRDDEDVRRARGRTERFDRRELGIRILRVFVDQPVIWAIGDRQDVSLQAVANLTHGGSYPSRFAPGSSVWWEVEERHLIRGNLGLGAGLALTFGVAIPYLLQWFRRRRGDAFDMELITPTE